MTVRSALRLAFPLLAITVPLAATGCQGGGSAAGGAGGTPRWMALLGNGDESWSWDANSLTPADSGTREVWVAVDLGRPRMRNEGMAIREERRYRLDCAAERFAVRALFVYDSAGQALRQSESAGVTWREARAGSREAGLREAVCAYLRRRPGRAGG